MRRPLPVLPVAAGCRNANPSRTASPRPGRGLLLLRGGRRSGFCASAPLFSGRRVLWRSPRSPSSRWAFPPVDSVPQTTVVPVQQPPVQVVEHTTVYEESTRGMTRPERRAYRAKLYAQKIDSLVQSRDYLFFPNSMQEVPGGMIRSIYTDYYFFGSSSTTSGSACRPRAAHADISTCSISTRRPCPITGPSAWRGAGVSPSGLPTAIRPTMPGFEVSTATGETVLTLAAPDLVMRYVGWLWDKRIGDPKFRRLD